jgi:hypothetical protein
MALVHQKIVTLISLAPDLSGNVMIISLAMPGKECQSFLSPFNSSRIHS